MTPTDKLKALIEKESTDELIVFLKALSEPEKKELVPALKELNAYYTEFVDLSTMQAPDSKWQAGRSYGTRARGRQGLVLAIASFVCLDKKGFEKTVFPTSILKQEILDQLLPWYVPSWFGKLLDEANKGNSYRLSYDLIMQLQAEGHFTPSPELILIHFPGLIFPEKITPAQAEKILLKYPDTLNKHFWYIFEYPSNIANLSRYYKSTKNWNDFILKFATEGRLDRARILKETLLTANRNFNKILAGWFVELFSFLKPTEEELQTLEPELMTLLDSKHTTAVSLGLNSLKQLKDFDYHTFITHLPQVILSGTKSILNTVLQLSETICKEHPDARQPIAIQLCQVFLNKDEGLQQKTAKLISTYAFPPAEDLQQQLQLYADTMLTSTRPLLLRDAAAVVLADDTAAENLPLIGEHNLIPPVNTVEDLVYFASQAFENNAPYHAELLPAAFIHLQHLITEDVLVQLQPAFKRAEKLHAHPTANMGQLDNLLTKFLLDYTKGQTSAWKETEDYVRPYTILWQYALEKLQAKNQLPLLSTPTHTPCWIDPLVLVERLAQYKDQAPHELDLQLAVCRCALEDTAAAIALAKQVLSGEHKELVLYLLDQSAGTPRNGNAWVQAANRKGISIPTDKLAAVYINGNFEWETKPEKYKAYGSYISEKRDYERITATRISIRINIPASTPLHAKEPLLQDYLVNRSRYYSLIWQDVPRLLSLTPANSSLMLANIIQHCMPLSGMYEVTETSTITAAISWLKEQAIPYLPTVHLFMATCMLHADKTIRALAAECWITGVSANRLESSETGRIIGIHQSVEWAPLKRFTDLVTEHMMQISRQHNEALELLLSNCIACLPDHAVKNLKKLLEVYGEVLAVNGHKVTDLQVMNRLKVWESLPGFKKLTSSLT
ncbi:DUF6493 family protein [Chitinophaga sancti]|uniref:DUF6493 family protein n=1 Tax=Chitinophaga sancti TaxID=1004 RepID=UPI003F7AB7B4